LAGGSNESRSGPWLLIMVGELANDDQVPRP
jgi:hypothetical protein